MDVGGNIVDELKRRLGAAALGEQRTADGVPTVWVRADRAHEALACARESGYDLLYDLFGVDERLRKHRPAEAGDFTVVYQLLSTAGNCDVRIKAPAPMGGSVATVADLWPNADWYERELWDMLGVGVTGHPNLRRILMPPWWTGHPLRKDHPARATEMEPFAMPEDRWAEMEKQLQFDPEAWGLRRHDGEDDTEFMFLNLGPHHPGTHGVLRLVLQLRDEQIVNVVPEIGFHHRGAEKMGERQSWHSYIPYTDRVDYLAGTINNLPYLLSVEKLCGIEVPPRAAVIRVMMCELYRIVSHLVWYGTFTLDLGAFSTVFYMFTDRERVLEIAEAVTGARMHPGWFRIGGTAADLPDGWDKMVRAFVAYFERRLDEYDRMIMDNRIFIGRTKGVGAIDTAEAIRWGMTGPNLRATGLAWDFRKKRPYGGYEQFEFDIPTAGEGDCLARAQVRVQEMRQSLRIVRQCVENMPAGDYKSRHPLATPPIKPRTMHDIETLITHFLGVSYGPVVPPGEANVLTEGAKGAYSYYLTSDGGTGAYRTRIRVPSFPHIQAAPRLTRGLSVSDLIAILGSIDFVLADVDR